MRPPALLIVIGIFSAFTLRAQAPEFSFSLTLVHEKCSKGSATLKIDGTVNKDSTAIEWSTAARNVKNITQLTEGPYWVRVHIRRKQDTLIFTRDTTIHFAIEKTLCPVGVPGYFSPNGDGYADELNVQNANKHPDFEFYVYNRYGQQVHSQKGEFTPWDGTWNGIPLPDGTYYYIFFYTSGDQKQVVKGDLTILR